MRHTLRLTLTLIVACLVPCLPLLAQEEHFFDSDGVQIRYIEEGEGEPVVLIHGFTANAENNWVLPGIFKTLAEDYRVIALDCRGHGKSGKPHQPSEYGREMGLDVVRLLDHLKLEEAHLAGYSMGGFITLGLLATHPERLASAILGGAGWSPPGATTEFQNQLADSLEAGKGFGPLIRLLTPAGQPPMPAEQLEAINNMLASSNDTHALAAVMRGLGENSATADQVRAINVPTLAVIGEIDPLKVGVDAMKAILPELEVVVVAGADHMTAFSRPEFQQAMKAFLDAQTALVAAAVETSAASNF